MCCISFETVISVIKVTSFFSTRCVFQTSEDKKQDVQHIKRGRGNYRLLCQWKYTVRDNAGSCCLTFVGLPCCCGATCTSINIRRDVCVYAAVCAASPQWLIEAKVAAWEGVEFSTAVFSARQTGLHSLVFAFTCIYACVCVRVCISTFCILSAGLQRGKTLTESFITLLTPALRSQSIKWIESTLSLCLRAWSVYK